MCVFVFGVALVSGSNMNVKMALLKLPLSLRSLRRATLHYYYFSPVSGAAAPLEGPRNIEASPVCDSIQAKQPLRET